MVKMKPAKPASSDAGNAQPAKQKTLKKPKKLTKTGQETKEKVDAGTSKPTTKQTDKAKSSGKKVSKIGNDSNAAKPPNSWTSLLRSPGQIDKAKSSAEKFPEAGTDSAQKSWEANHSGTKCLRCGEWDHTTKDCKYAHKIERNVCHYWMRYGCTNTQCKYHHWPAYRAIFLKLHQKQKLKAEEEKRQIEHMFPNWSTTSSKKKRPKKQKGAAGGLTPKQKHQKRLLQRMRHKDKRKFSSKRGLPKAPKPLLKAPKQKAAK